MSVVVAGRSVAALGFVGLGVMGEGMCGNLAERSRLPVFAVDKRPEPLERLVARGVTACRDAAEVARRSDVVFLCLASDEQVRDACFGSGVIVGAEARTRVVVDCGTTSVALTRECAARAGEHGVTWVDAPIARGREAARTGTLLLMVGAEPATFAALEPLLNCMGSDVQHCGLVGSGQVVKILNNKVMLQTVHALAEALAIARAAGVDGAVLFDAFSKGSADSHALRLQGMHHLLTGDFPVNAFPTVYARKDIGLALSLADTVGVTASLAHLTASLLDRAIAAGHGNDYYPVIQKLLDVRRIG